MTDRPIGRFLKSNQQNLENELQLNCSKKMVKVEVVENEKKVKFLDQTVRRSERLKKVIK